MTDFPIPMDPDLEGVLRDVIADPRASTFVASPVEVARGAWSGVQAVRESQSGLRPAEKELLRVHRSELAYLLRLLFFQEFSADRHTGKLHHFFGEPESTQPLGARIEESLALTPAHESLTTPAEILRAFASGARGRWTLGDVAAASLRLEDATNARLYLANWLMASGQKATARDLLRVVLSEPQSALDRYLGLQWLAVYHSQRDEVSESLGLSVRSARIARDAALGGGWLVPALVNVIVPAIHFGRTHEAEWAAAALDEAAPRGDARVARRLERVRAELSSADGAAPPEGIALARRIRASSTGPSEEIAEVFES